MAEYKIKSARYGESVGGFACGPVGGAALAEVEIQADNGRHFFVSLSNLDGFQNYYKTEECTFDFQQKEDYDDEDGWNELEEHLILELEDSESPFDVETDNMAEIYKYLYYLTRVENSECERFVQETVGENIDDIEIANPDAEVE